jgi:hypothetical protein
MHAMFTASGEGMKGWVVIKVGVGADLEEQVGTRTLTRELG